MDMPTHDLGELFEQLGLPCSSNEIDAFIQQNRPLADDIKISEAPFWTPAQQAFLREQLIADADWAELVDQLSLRLR